MNTLDKTILGFDFGFPSHTLLKRAISRLTLLSSSIATDKGGRALDTDSKTIGHHLEAISILDKTLQNKSDENLISIFRQVSTTRLMDFDVACNIFESNDGSIPSNPRQQDYELATMGYTVGSQHTGRGDVLRTPSSRYSIAQWVQMLDLAGSDTSVRQA